MPARATHILFVSANPIAGKPVDTDGELREINKRIEETKHASRFRVTVAPSARFEDLLQRLSRSPIDIVHLSAHGTPLHEILLMHEAGAPHPIRKNVLVELFKILKQPPRMVVLSACYSESQAKALSQYVELVIGTPRLLPDSAAISFAAHFYGELASGNNVQDAYRQSRLLVASSVADTEQHPALHVRPDTDPATIKFVARRRPTPPDQARFMRDQKRFGTSADSLAVAKICRADGSSTIHYQLSALRAFGDELLGIEFYLGSATGSVSYPLLDSAAQQLGIKWEPHDTRTAPTLEGAIESVHSASGLFRFNSPMRPGDDPYTFGWEVQILNGDALTVWEFMHLYAPEQRIDLDGRHLVPPSGNFARAVWFPIRELEVRVTFPKMPPGTPFVRQFQIPGNASLPAREVLVNGFLRSCPVPGPLGSKQARRWEANNNKKQSHAIFACDPEARECRLNVPFPPVGSCYSIEWPLSPSNQDEEFDILMQEAERIREALLARRTRRLQHGSAEYNDVVCWAFRSLHDELRTLLASTNPEEHFEVTLMTYDRSSRRLVMVESSAEPPDESWNFWLPFGLGVSGHCFRVGGQAVAYLRPREERAHEVEYYLPVPGRPAYAALLALPIDHPDFELPVNLTPELGTLQPERCRQTVAVVTIASTRPTRNMFRLCGSVRRLSPQDRQLLEKVRTRCQAYCNTVAKYYLELPEPNKDLAPPNHS